jgi:hypothetical protein
MLQSLEYPTGYAYSTFVFIAVVSEVAAVVSFVLDDVVAVLHATSAHIIHAAAKSCFIKSSFNFFETEKLKIFLI